MVDEPNLSFLINVLHYYTFMIIFRFLVENFNSRFYNFTKSTIIYFPWKVTPKEEHSL